MRYVRAIVTITALIAQPCIAHAAGSPSPFFVTGAEMPPPRGFLDMCRGDGGDCGEAVPVAGSDDRVASRRLSDAAMLERINQTVNRRVRQQDDRATFGRDEVWRRSGVARGAAGDCEDIAIEKRDQLVAAGYPASRLFLAVAFARGIGLHVVLVARLTDGDVILDSRDPAIRLRTAVPYSWISVQSPDNPMRWYKA